MCEELDNEHEEQQPGGGRAKATNPVGQFTEFDLERSWLVLRLQAHQDLSIRAVRTDAGDEVGTDSLENLGAADDERVKFVGRSAVLNSLPYFLTGSLLHLVGLTSCRRFIAFDAMARDEDSICGDGVARLEMEN